MRTEVDMEGKATMAWKEAPDKIWEEGEGIVGTQQS